MKLTKETLKRIIKEELEESRLRRHLRQDPRIKKIINHPLMEIYLGAYFGTLGNDGWSNQDPNVGLETAHLNELGLYQKILNHPELANKDEELANAVIAKLQETDLDGEFMDYVKHQQSTLGNKARSKFSF